MSEIPSPILSKELPTGTLKVFAGKSELALAAADFVTHTLRAALKKKGRASLALSGGSTPEAVYRLLAQGVVNNLDWHRVDIFFSDERNVPPTHQDSNYRMVKETLLSSERIPDENVHRIEGELPAEQAAERYQAELRRILPMASGFPVFDLILLGIGPDGHTASLFPDTSALDEKQKWVAANWVEKLNAHRITFTFPVLNNASVAAFLVSGDEKKTISREILEGEEKRYPAQLVKPVQDELVWLLDRAAAANLSSL